MSENTEELAGHEPDEDQMLAELLQAGVLFMNTRKYLGYRGEGLPVGETTVLFVLANDVFAWGCADAEDIPDKELPTLYRMWKSGRRHRFIALRRTRRCL